MSLRHLSTFRGIATEIRLLSSSAGDPPKKSGLRSETRRHVGSRATECPAWFFRFQRAARFGDARLHLLFTSGQGPCSLTAALLGRVKRANVPIDYPRLVLLPAPFSQRRDHLTWGNVKENSFWRN